jgi:8-oxo-dGTP pyrophosphatase MutT (NUDIX family)
VVRLIVPDASGRVLVLKRAPDSTEGGRWCLPGGKMDYGDTVEQAAMRELQEETSLRSTNLRFLFYQDNLPPAPGRMHCVTLYFECSVEGEVVLNEESIEAAWISPGELARFHLAFRNDEALVRYWAEA